MTLPSNLHPLNSITLFKDGDVNRLLAFGDTQEAVIWLIGVCEKHHKHQETRALVTELSSRLYMMRARHTHKGNLKVLAEQ